MWAAYASRRLGEMCGLIAAVGRPRTITVGATQASSENLYTLVSRGSKPMRW
jgi:hypothetical protein